VVVGAGPAGCTAAKIAAEQGANVLLLEEHPKPGLPVFCGEAISGNTLTASGLKPEPPIINQTIRKANVYTPNGKHLTIINDKIPGYIINRDIFDAKLAENAEAAGVKLLVGTRASAVTKNNGVVVGVKAEKHSRFKQHSDHFNIKAKIVIGADGHASTIRRTALGTPYFKSLGICVQYTLTGLNIQDPNAVEIRIGRKYAPGGYAWIFPKSRTVANVGLSIRMNQAIKPAIQYLQDFIKQKPKLRGRDILYKTGGMYPVTGTLDKIVDDGVMLIGDAAGQLIPMTGAGIETAIHAGKIAGNVAVRAIQENNVSKTRLAEYPEIFNNHWGKVIEGSKKMLNLFDNLDDNDLNKLSEIITPNQVKNLANGEKVIRSLIVLILKAPILTLKIIARESDARLRL
jgi:digeranylgeranylglycerophospholipid reductase